MRSVRRLYLTILLVFSLLMLMRQKRALEYVAGEMVLGLNFLVSKTLTCLHFARLPRIKELGINSSTLFLLSFVRSGTFKN